jgi:hypothetical protein
MPAQTLGVVLDDWNLLFDAVLARLRDTVVRDAAGHVVCPVVLECVATLEQLRQSHPLTLACVR